MPPGPREPLGDRGLLEGALRPLPENAYVLATLATATVNLDYHVEFESHFYNTPYLLAHKQVEIRATAMAIEVLFNNERGFERWA